MQWNIGLKVLNIYIETVKMKRNNTIQTTSKYPQTGIKGQLVSSLRHSKLESKKIDLYNVARPNQQ